MPGMYGDRCAVAVKRYVFPQNRSIIRMFISKRKRNLAGHRGFYHNDRGSGLKTGRRIKTGDRRQALSFAYENAVFNLSRHAFLRQTLGIAAWVDARCIGERSLFVSRTISVCKKRDGSKDRDTEQQVSLMKISRKDCAQKDCGKQKRY